MANCGHIAFVTIRGVVSLIANVNLFEGKIRLSVSSPTSFKWPEARGDNNDVVARQLRRSIE
jgi:hypothetical protein